MSSLIRALSWPLITTTPCENPKRNSTKIPNQDNNLLTVPQTNGVKPTAATFQQLVAARRLLCRRYYPEGGWGWIIIFVAVWTNLLTHGLQLSFGIHLDITTKRFHQQWINSGNSILIYKFMV